MKDTIKHVPTSRVIDLAGLMDAETFAYLESLQHTSHRRDPSLLCGSCNTGLYLRRNPLNRDSMHGVHFISSGCHDLVARTAPRMSDEHKRECEYHAKAGQAAGFTADLEVTTTGKTRVDVVVGDAGFEIQRSALGVRPAKERTARSMKSGLSVVSWFTDRPGDPVWWAKVPSYRTTMTSWDQLPPLRTVNAAGPQIVTAMRCDVGAFQQCPRGNTRPCGKYHETYKPWPRLLVDDVVTAMASGEMVAAYMGNHVRLVSPDSVRIYEELTSSSAHYDGALLPQPGPRTLNGRVECARPIQPGWFARPDDCEQLPLPMHLVVPDHRTHLWDH